MKIVKEVTHRISTNFQIKLLLGTILTIAIYAGYLLIQNHLVFSPVVLQPTPLDRALPFLPDSVYIYQSIWFLVPIAPWLMLSLKELSRYTIALTLICSISFIIFFFLPTSVPRPSLPAETNLVYQILTQIDKELNGFPSLHVSLVLFHALCCQKIFSDMRLKGWITLVVWVWAGAIIISTLLTKQHIFYDLLGGLVVGLLGFAVFNYKKWFFQGLLPTGKIEKKIGVINDGIVNLYVIEGDGGIICIDAGWRESKVRYEFKKLGLDIEDVTAVFLTHSHFDHSRCASLYPRATIYSRNNMLSSANVRVKEGDKFQINGCRIEVIETPGHSDCSVSYLVDGHYLFTGDLLQIKEGKPFPFYRLFNKDNKALRTSMDKIENHKEVHSIFTAHHGVVTISEKT